MRREFREKSATRSQSFGSTSGDTRSVLARVKDQLPKGIMKRRNVDSRERMLFNDAPHDVANSWEPFERTIRSGGGRETSERFEKTHRTEEVERSVNRRSRSRYNASRGAEWHGGQFRSTSVHPDYNERFGHSRDMDDHTQRYSTAHQRSYSNQPYVEYPPTLPRTVPQHRETEFYQPISKTRSYADSSRRSEMGRLEKEFRDSLLMPLPRPETEHHMNGAHEYYGYQRSDRGLRRVGPPYYYSEPPRDYERF